MVELVNYGVDTLYANIYYTDDAGKRIKRDLAPALETQLTEWKKEAQGVGEPMSTSLVFNGAKLHMYPNGAGRGQYPWLLKSDDLTLCVSAGHWNGIASARFSSAYLWSCRGLSDAIGKVAAFLDGMFSGSMWLQPSSLDLCADIAGWDDVESLDRHRHFVTRSLKKTMYSQPEWGYHADLADYSYGLHGTGFDFSRNGSLSCKIYDKTREMKLSGKEWFADLWRSRGWDESAHSKVWRVEFSFKRELLRELKQGTLWGLEDALQLPGQLELLWTYAAGHRDGADGCPDGWLRCVVPNTDKNRSRWPTHPAWTVVQSAFADPIEGPQHFGVIIRKGKEDHNIAKGVEAMIGYATSLAAWVGGPLADPDADLSMFLHWFMGRGSAYLERKGLDFGTEVQRKRVKFGLPVENNKNSDEMEETNETNEDK